MQRNLTFLLVSIFFASLTFKSYAQCPNRALSFDGSDDFLEVNPGPITGLPLTVEFFAQSRSTSNQTTCSSNMGETLFWMGTSPGDFLRIAECNGELFIETGNSSGTQGFPATGSPSVRTAMRHIAISLSPSGSDFQADLFIDCINVLSQTIPAFTLSNPGIVLGQNGTLAGPLNSFRGEMDDFRSWNSSRSVADLCTFRKCLPANGSPDLLLYFKMDEGLPSGSNLGLTSLVDNVSNGPVGTINNFDLIGGSSNFICSRSGLIYPDLNEVELNITDYPSRTTAVNKICSGDPVHFCLELDGMPIAPNPDISVVWEVNDGSGWVALPSTIFNGFCFGVPPGEITIDCSSSLTGEETLQFRIISTVSTGPSSVPCTYISKEFSLDVCCPVEPSSVMVGTGYPGDLLCDGDPVTFNVSLNSYPFITALASGVSIDWKFNGVPISFSNQASFSFPATADVTAGACFEATVNFCGKTGVFETCIPIDPIPVCGEIDTLMKPTALTKIGSMPDVYEICPGQDAALKIKTPFTDCNPTWQYSFSNGPGAVWIDLGSSNSQQNTNILPTSLWPGSNIFYRIECRPLSDPSGCEPCYSNVIEIRLKQGPSPGAISGNNYICFGGSTTLTNTGLDPTLSHQWICNGRPVGTGSPTLAATEGGCYWIESMDDCYSIQTNKFCLDVCIIEPIISCPDVCPKPGVAITLDGCSSTDSCNQGLTYSWSVTGSNAPTINGCAVTHIPDPTGSTYTLTVTNSYGCTASTSVTIIPCEE
jgi:hypothetical protein